MTEPTSPGATLFPAIDLRRGRCVRLEQGSPDRQTVYDADPFRMAEQFVSAGAEWIHVVDLDAALGEGSNRTLIAELARAIPARFQIGGGLRGEGDIASVLDGRVARAVIGTAAIEQPDLVRLAIDRWGSERIVVGLDARGRRPAIRGWRDEAPGDFIDIAQRLATSGVSTFVYTDISRDGMFAGPNIDMSIELADRTGAAVVISGGVGRIEDIDDVRSAREVCPGIAGVIVGKAVYEGKVDVAEAVRRLRKSEG